MQTILDVLPTRWRQKPGGIDTKGNYVTVTVCIAVGYCCGRQGYPCGSVDTDWRGQDQRHWEERVSSIFGQDPHISDARLPVSRDVRKLLLSRVHSRRTEKGPSTWAGQWPFPMLEYKYSFLNQIYGSNVIERHSETVMV